jgi:hypothetical protein
MLVYLEVSGVHTSATNPARLRAQKHYFRMTRTEYLMHIAIRMFWLRWRLFGATVASGDSLVFFYVANVAIRAGAVVVLDHCVVFSCFLGFGAVLMLEAC